MNTEQRIRSLVPELQELSFGCEMSNPWASETNPIKKGFYVKGKGYDTELTDKKGKFWLTSKDTEILGHPIELHHVLQAIGGVGVSRYSYGDNRINDKVADIFECWDLTKNFSSQSKETQDFIGELLK